MSRPISVTVNAAALKHNFSLIRNFDPRKKIWSVLKGNGYGHGLRNVFVSLSESDGFAVLDINDAILLREWGWIGPILLIEGFFSEEELKLIALYYITIVIHSIEQIHMIEKIGDSTFKQWIYKGFMRLKQQAEISKNYPKFLKFWHDVFSSRQNNACCLHVYLKMNTGMNRLGFRPDDFITAWYRLKMIDFVGEITLMTHFSYADALFKKHINSNLTFVESITYSQFQLFQQVVQNLPGKISVANSAAILWAPELYGDWIRPGIILYGASPSGNSQHIACLQLQTVMNFSTEIIAVQNINPGELVGYGEYFRAKKTMKIGIIACGYADGYPRHANVNTPVWVNGVHSYVVGRVSMDMLTIDLTCCPNAGIGTKVELWGPHISVDDVAKTCSTISYELLTAIMPRVPIFLINT